MPQDGEMPEKEAPRGDLTLLEEEEEGYSGSDDALEEDGAAESVSALDQEDEDFQCPKEEDTVKLGDSPTCKNCPRFLLVRKARIFSRAQVSGLGLRPGVGTGTDVSSLCIAICLTEEPGGVSRGWDPPRCRGKRGAARGNRSPAFKWLCRWAWGREDEFWRLRDPRLRSHEFLRGGLSILALLSCPAAHLPEVLQG